MHEYTAEGYSRFEPCMCDEMHSFQSTVIIFSSL